MDERTTYERKYAGSTFRRKLFCCLSKYCAKVLVITRLLLKPRGDSKRELGIKFNSPNFIANVSLILVHAHVYERYVNFASYYTAKKNVLSSNLQTCNFVVDPDHHILAWLMKVMHDDRKCNLSVMICKTVTLFKIKKIDQVLS